MKKQKKIEEEFDIEEVCFVTNGEMIPPWVNNRYVINNARGGDVVIKDRGQGVMLITPEHPLHKYLSENYD